MQYFNTYKKGELQKSTFAFGLWKFVLLIQRRHFQTLLNAIRLSFWSKKLLKLCRENNSKFREVSPLKWKIKLN